MMCAQRCAFRPAPRCSNVTRHALPPTRPTHLGIRQYAGAALAAVMLGACGPASAEVTPVYFGNGCFWGRQKDFVDAEMRMGRDMKSSTAVVGYAGGRENGKATCYYYNAPDTLYEKQGHAEVVQVGLDSSEAAKQLATFSETYFSQFNKARQGMIRQDPQDRGPGYRSVVGIPGGMDSELFEVFASKNKNNMRLVRGEGNAFTRNKPSEDDMINTVYVYDSTELPFHQAEAYHQYHNGMTKDFPAAYLVDLKKAKMREGAIGPIQGCLEYPF